MLHKNKVQQRNNFDIMNTEELNKYYHFIFLVSHTYLQTRKHLSKLICMSELLKEKKEKCQTTKNFNPNENQGTNKQQIKPSKNHQKPNKPTEAL